MNDTLAQYAKSQLKEKLALCSEAQILLFKRMYSHQNLEASIEEVIDNMHPSKYDHALGQIERTLAKNQSK